MDVQHLSEADLHLVFGLLLKKKRTPSQERKVLSILRSELDLPAKIEAIVKVSRVQVLEIGGAQADGHADAAQSPDARKKTGNGSRPSSSTSTPR